MEKKSNENTQLKKEKTRKLALTVIFIISFLSFVLLAYILLKHSILPIKMRFAGIIVLIIIYVILQILISTLRITKPKFTIIAIILILLLILQAAIFIYVNKGLSIFHRIGQKQDTEEISYSLLVLKTSEYESLESIGDTVVGAAMESDRKNVAKFIDKFNEENNLTLRIREGGQYIQLAQDLIASKQEIILFNEAYRSTVEDQIDDFAEKTRVLNETRVSTEKEGVYTKGVSNEEPFNLYISGIDTYGSLSNVSRTDVNLLLTVNPKARKVLITSIPRDTYVRIPMGGNDEFDKLTHSGIYGIETSIKTIENFFDTPINYYARVNFNSLIKVVDVLGGIEVNNDRAFTAFDGKRFESGTIQLDGERALSFSRERKNLPGGDNDRGKNHIRVIEGIIKKALSPSILFNYHGLMDEVYNSTDTNVGSSKLIELINAQIEDNREWTFESSAIEGSPRMDLPSHAMPGWKLYMMEPNQESVTNAKTMINEVLAR